MLQFSEEAFKVVYKRPTDLTLIGDVPVCANLLIANILDEGGFGVRFGWSGLGCLQSIDSPVVVKMAAKVLDGVVLC